MLKELSKSIKYTIRPAIVLAVNIIFYPLKVIFENKNIIIIQTHSKYRYGGSPRYLFEYLSRNSKYDVYWATESPVIKKYLKERNLKFISSSNLIEKFKVSLGAKIIVDSGSGYYNFIGLSGHKSYKICTMHGSGPKLTSKRYMDFDKSLHIPRQYNKFDYVSFCTEHAAMVVGQGQLMLPPQKTVILGSPKSDQFFDVKCNDLYNNKIIVNSIIPELKGNERIIYYTPTFRPYKSPSPIVSLKGYNCDAFYDFLESNDIYLIYSHHSMSQFTEDLIVSDRVVFFDFKDYPLVDNNQLLMEVDILMGDYSTLATDFSITRRPQLFIMPDYDLLKQTKGFAEELRKLAPGPEITSFDELTSYLVKYLNDSDAYHDHYGEVVDRLLDKYMDPFITNSCERFKLFFDDLIVDQN